MSDEGDWGDLDLGAGSLGLSLASQDSGAARAMEGVLRGMDDEDDDDWGDLDLAATPLPVTPTVAPPPQQSASDLGLDLEVLGTPRGGGAGGMLQLRLRSDERPVQSGEEETAAAEPQATYNRAKQQWEGGHLVDMTGFESTDEEDATEGSTGPGAHLAFAPEDGDEEDWDADFDVDPKDALPRPPPINASPFAEVARKNSGIGGGPTLITFDDLAAQGIDVAALAAAQEAAAREFQPAEMLDFYREDDDELDAILGLTGPGPQLSEGTASAPGASPRPSSPRPASPQPRGHKRATSGPTLLRPEDVKLAETAGQGGQQSVYDAEKKRWVQVSGVYVGALEPRHSAATHRRPSAATSTGSGNRLSNPEDFELPGAVVRYFRRCEEEHQDVMRLILGEGLFRRLRREGKDRLKARSPYLQRSDDASDATSDSGHSDEFASDLEEAGNGYNSRLQPNTPDAKRVRRRRSERTAAAEAEAADSGTPSGGRKWKPTGHAAGPRKLGASAGWVRPSGPVRVHKPAGVDAAVVEAAAATRPTPLQNVERATILAAQERQLRRFEEARRLALGRPELT